MLSINLQWFETVSSTNDVCMSKVNEGAKEGLVVAARYQEQGRGQRGNIWESARNQNLTFSILIRPTFLQVVEQFYLSKVTALAITDWLSAYIDNKTLKIKWPNDIYINNNKIAGILIENSFSGRNIDYSVIGIGINLNQTVFPDDVPNPTSLKLETQREYPVDQFMPEILNCFAARYEMLQNGYLENLDKDYFNLIYRKDIFCRYFADGNEFDAKIIDVLKTGELVLQNRMGQIKHFAFKEVMFVI